MKPGGWILIILSWGFILWLAGFCLAKIFSKKELE